VCQYLDAGQKEPESVRGRHVEPVIAVENQLRPDDAAEVASRLRQVIRGRASLDLRPLDSVVRAGKNLDPNGIAVLSNVLLTSQGSRELAVILPAADATLSQLARGDFWFALAQRRGPTHIQSAEPREVLFSVPPSVADLNVWRDRWDPSDQEFRSRVWGTTEEVPTQNGIGTAQPDFIAFVNPHLSVTRDRLVKELNENVASGWLSRLNTTPRFVSAASEVVTELLYNFTAHPFSTLLSRPIGKRDVPMNRRFGTLSLFTTSGGGGDRLHIFIFDTGHGIPATLRPKFQKRTQPELGDDRELLESLLDRTLPPYGRGEGRGFPRLVQLVLNYQGSMHVITSCELDITNTLIGRLESNEGRVVVTALPHCDVSGTTVHVSLTLDREDQSVNPPLVHQRELALT
jgi:hypothetical protein